MTSENPADYVLDPAIADKLTFTDAGLIPVIVQAEASHEVLMMAWMDSHALAYTLASRRGTYFSRSRNEYWIKGLTSGHVQEVVSVQHDCDGDSLLMIVRQTGAACHTGSRTCFDDRVLLDVQTPGLS
ncbi:phosphoribosyl-AMP cyclohydrolase [Corynebacterium epidermidicanis]|uniref:Phosphoribosyl-AMP cyclohydrolase n=1 Tax=Corynebacterium epidermidicanis TaxID=1050174 RepID=A0A0G3GSA9_9CORY|nr:phosphoribosyl-AMP cyclohydrolase [Corynebacterium epidermidicanis]AKK03465.1 phosphoribosyl-AMP cyclohydrolase [Corynebacterium epidermidicanis]